MAEQASAATVSESKEVRSSETKARKLKSAPCKYLWYSGWELSPADFVDFVRGVPDMRPSEKGSGQKRYDVMTHVDAYDSWRRRVLQSRGTFKPPPMRVREHEKDSERILGLFFTTRARRYRSKKQVDGGHPDAEAIKVPTELDLAYLAAFQTGIVQEHDGQLDISKPVFSYMKDFHPKHDPYRAINF